MCESNCITEDEFFHLMATRTCGNIVVITSMINYVNYIKKPVSETYKHIQKLFPGNTKITIEMMREKLDNIEGKCSRCSNTGKFVNKCSCGGYINNI